jgi:preprotein translocase subunit SecE
MMNAKLEKAGGTSPLDMVKLALAAVLLAAGVVAYYYFADWTGWARFGVLLAGMVAAAAVGAFTAPGRAVREYLSESQFELRKVVWPTREETLRTTLVVIVVVIILSLLLGLIDVMLKWAVLDNLLKMGR